jgi:hypothetical protein
MKRIYKCSLKKALSSNSPSQVDVLGLLLLLGVMA